MTTLPNGRLDSFKNRVWNTGLDRDRCRIVREPGVFKVAANASFREGQPLMLDSSGLVVAHDGATANSRLSSPLLGVAKANCMNLGRAVINETLTFTAAGQTRNLRRAVLAAGQITARTGATQHSVATAGAANVDFIVDYANGTLQHNSAPGESDVTVFPAVVEVQYVIELTASDYEFEGRNFFNQLNDVVTQDNMVTVIQAPSVVYTTEYVNPLGTLAANPPPVVFTAAGGAWAVGHAVGIATSGLFTNLGPHSGATAGLVVGYCVSPPTASDPWLGIELLGSR